jgi:hypothetical protein
MTIAFANDNDVIVYALEKIISYARTNQYIFLAQSVWWISSIIGLQQSLINLIDNLKARAEVNLAKEVPDTSDGEIPTSEVIIHPDRVHQIQHSEDSYIVSDIESISTTETDIHNEVIDNCEAFLEQSREERKAIGRNTRHISRIINRKAERKANWKAQKPIKTFGTQTEGIDGSELRRRKAAGECQRCAWSPYWKGSHTALNCKRRKRVEKGTAPTPKKYNKD